MRHRLFWRQRSSALRGSYAQRTLLRGQDLLRIGALLGDRLFCQTELYCPEDIFCATELFSATSLGIKKWNHDVLEEHRSDYIVGVKKSISKAFNAKQTS